MSGAQEYSAEEIGAILTGDAPSGWKSSMDPAWEYQPALTDDEGRSSPGYFINANTGDRREASSVEGKYTPDRLTGVDVSNLPTHKGLNFEGTPTEFYDAEGALKGLLVDTYRWGGKGQQIVDPNNFNLALGEGEKPSINSYVQSVNDKNQLMYIDPHTGKNTTDNTGVPATTHQLKDLLYMQDPGSRSRIAQDAKGLAYVITAALGGAAMGGAFGGAGAVAGGGLGAGEVATAYPVLSGGALGGTELGAIGAGGIGAGEVAAGGLGSAGLGGAGAGGSLTAGITPASVSAFEAALPATMGEIGGLSGTAAGAGSGLTAAEVLKYAKYAQTAAGALGVGGASAGGGGGGATAAGDNYSSYGTGGGGALPGSLTTSALGVGSAAMLDPFKDYNKYQQIQAVQNEQAMQRIPVSRPLYAASGGDVAGLAQIQERLSQLDPRLNSVLQNKLKANYYTYGTDNTGGLPTQLMGSQLGAKPSPGYPSQSVSNAKASLYDTYGFKPAGLNSQERTPETIYAKEGGHIPEFITGATGHYVRGRGDGQSDSIPAMLADGEYVFDAETVAQLGNGSSDAGADILDRMRQNIRAHKRSAPIDKIPPKSKSPLEYMAESKRK